MGQADKRPPTKFVAKRIERRKAARQAKSEQKSLKTSTKTARSKDATVPEQPVEVHAPSSNLLASRVARILELIKLMQSDGIKTAEAFAARFNVTRRTIFRDLNVLERAGVPFSSTPAGYVLRQDYELAQLKLGVGEAIGLMVLDKVARAIPHQPLFGDAIEAISRCLAQLPPSTLAVYQDLVENVSYAPGFVSVGEEDEQHFCTLQSAIDECTVCELSYKPVGDHDRVDTLIHPLHLHFYKHSWYALAHSLQHEEVRMFKLARIEALEPTSQQFPPMDFSIDEHLDSAWGIIPGDKIYDIEIEFSPKVARNVSEIRWHASQQQEMQRDGSCIMRFRVNGLDEMKWWLFSYAGEAYVRKPSELREKLRDMARQMLDATRDRD